MKSSPPYVICHRYKGQPKKHVRVCRDCRWKKGCVSFQRFLQPELPFSFDRIPGRGQVRAKI